MNRYLIRTYEQIDDELAEVVASPNLALRDKAAQVATAVRLTLDELYAQRFPDSEAQAEQLLPDIERRLQEIRALIAPTLKSTDIQEHLTQKP